MYVFISILLFSLLHCDSCPCFGKTDFNLCDYTNYSPSPTKMTHELISNSQTLEKLRAKPFFFFFDIYMEMRIEKCFKMTKSESGVCSWSTIEMSNCWKFQNEKLSCRFLLLFRSGDEKKHSHFQSNGWLFSCIVFISDGKNHFVCVQDSWLRPSLLLLMVVLSGRN